MKETLIRERERQRDRGKIIRICELEKQRVTENTGRIQGAEREKFYRDIFKDIKYIKVRLKLCYHMHIAHLYDDLHK